MMLHLLLWLLTRLNPYCSGRWSRTGVLSYYLVCLINKVLILIVVEDGLVLKKKYRIERNRNVLILIVVEDGLVLSLLECVFNTWGES